MVGLKKEADQTGTFSRAISRRAAASQRASLKRAPRTTVSSSGRTRSVIRVIKPVMPSASATRSRSGPERSRTSPSGWTRRTETTFSRKAPYSKEP